MTATTFIHLAMDSHKRGEWPIIRRAIGVACIGEKMGREGERRWDSTRLFAGGWL